MKHWNVRLTLGSCLFGALALVAGTAPVASATEGSVAEAKLLAAAEDMKNPVNNAGMQLVNLYWEILELRYKFAETKAPSTTLEERYKATTKSYSKIANDLAARVVTGLQASDRKKLEDLSAFWKATDRVQRPALEPVVRQVVEVIKVRILEGKEPRDRAEQYFPGYGYGDPKYIYRRGREIERTNVSQYWQEETRTIESATHVEATIDIKIAAELKPQVQNFQQIGEPFKMDIGGHVIIVVKVTFDTKTTLTTKANKKYAVAKVWFELFNAPRDYWNEPKWSLCGKTYQLFDEPTGESAVTGISLGK